MKIIDISMNINENMMIYKNKAENKPVIEQQRYFETDGFNETRIEINVHTGTHMDAPHHMMKGGGTIDGIRADRLVTACKVLDFTGVKDHIGEAELRSKNIEKGDFLILKTDNSLDVEYNPDYVYLRVDGAAYLADRGITGVGIDALGIERDQPGHKSHLVLMSHDVLILEGLQLKDVEEGEYTLCALPLKIDGADGAPARAVLISGAL